MNGKLKVLVASVISSMMILSGCSGSKDAKETATAGKSSDTKTSETTGAAGDTKMVNSPIADYSKKPLTIRVAVNDFGGFDPDKDPIAKLIQQKFNITFVVEDPATFDVTLAAASGTLPDVFSNTPLYDVPAYQKFIDNGFIRTIPDEMIAKYPNIKKLVDSSDFARASKVIYKGLYSIPEPDSIDRNLYVADRGAIYYRKDWAEKLGFKTPPTTYADFKAMLDAFVNKDPDGNGKNDTLGLTNPGVSYLTSFGPNSQGVLSTWYKQADGTWTNGLLTPQMEKSLEYYRDLYTNGLIDPEFAQLKYQQAQQKFASGKAGAMFYYSDTTWIDGIISKQFGAANPTLKAYDSIGLIPYLQADSNTKPVIQKYLYDMCDIEFSSKASDEVVDRFLAFNNWVLSPEGRVNLLGVKGVDYNVDAQGNKTVILQDGKRPDIKTKYPSTGIMGMSSWAFDLSDDPAWPSPDITEPENARAVSKANRDARNQFATPVNMYSKLADIPSLATANAYKITTDISNVITGKEPVQTMFDALVKKAMDSGYRQAINDLNKYMKDHPEQNK
jgi:putative aldouronate transport system substrate-binding protein